MTDADKPGFVSMLSDALAYWRQDASAFTLRVWWDGCRRFDLEQVGKALSAHAADPERGRFPPLLADVVRQLHGTHTDRSLLAWGAVLEAARVVGAYESVVFDDPATHAAIEDLGGWPSVCRSDADELPFLQRRFCEAHRAYAQRPGLAYPPRLVGDHESSNRGDGRTCSDPVYIGDPRRASEVEQRGASGPRIAITTGANLARALLLAGASA